MRHWVLCIDERNLFVFMRCIACSTECSNYVDSQSAIQRQIKLNRRPFSTDGILSVRIFLHRNRCRFFHSLWCSSWNEKWISYLEKKTRCCSIKWSVWALTALQTQRVDQVNRSINVPTGSNMWSWWRSLHMTSCAIQSNPHMFSNVTNGKEIERSKTAFIWVFQRSAQLLPPNEHFCCCSILNFCTCRFFFLSLGSFMVVYRWYSVET